MRLLITGSTGLLGNNLVRKAIEAGHQVKALVRDASRPKSLEGVDCELAHGDVTDADSIMRGAEGVDAVIHSAAQIHLGWKNLETSMHINRDGTKHVVEACKKFDCKLVHISTVNTLAIGDRDGTVDETGTHDGQVPCNYVQTKRAAEALVETAAEEGLSAVIIHPGFMLGPWDWKPSSGRMLLEVGRQRLLPMAPSGGCSVCDVREVAAGILVAAERTLVHRHYILAGENISYFDLWTKFARLFGKRGPWTVMKPPGRFLIGKVGDLWAGVTGNESEINSAALQMSSQFHCYSSQRATQEWGYRIPPADESIQTAYDWFREHGYL